MGLKIVNNVMYLIEDLAMLLPGIFMKTKTQILQIIWILL